MNTCCFFLISCLFCLHIFVCNAFLESDLDETDRKCLEELKLDKSVVIGGFDQDDFILEGNAEFNQFYSCAWKRDGLQNDDGTINKQNLSNMVEVKFPGPKNGNYRIYLAREATAACVAVNGSDHGDTDVKIYNCILKKVGEISQRVKADQVA